MYIHIVYKQQFIPKTNLINFTIAYTEHRTSFSLIVYVNNFRKFKQHRISTTRNVFMVVKR